jgi:hypothetical protein
MSLTKLSLVGNNLIIPARENLVSDITARDGKIASLFYSACSFYQLTHAQSQIMTGLAFAFVLHFLPRSVNSLEKPNRKLKLAPGSVSSFQK